MAVLVTVYTLMISGLLGNSQRQKVIFAQSLLRPLAAPIWFKLLTAYAMDASYLNPTYRPGFSLVSSTRSTRYSQLCGSLPLNLRPASCLRPLVTESHRRLKLSLCRFQPSSSTRLLPIFFAKLPTLPALQLMTMALVFLSLLLRLLTLLALNAKGALCTVSRTACGARDLANFTSS